jgi:hypothetical protein
MYARFNNRFLSAGRPWALPSVSLLLLTLLGPGCTPDAGSDASGDFEFRILTSPAGDGGRYPYLAADGDDVLMAWLEPVDDSVFALRGSRFSGEIWGEPWTIAESQRFFVNWADFPSLVPLANGTLVAHWLQRGGQTAYDYSVQIATSETGGADWSPPRRLHDDDTPTEHGFVSLVPDSEGGVAAFWLDGRKNALAGDDDGDPETHGSEPAREMTVRGRRIHSDGDWGNEVLLDGRTCDCCQTAAVRLDDGRFVLAYRDRDPDEVRDIFVVRGREGKWEKPRPVFRDGWVMPACPVNGPSIAVAGESLAVAWFTGVGGEPRVSVAFSRDAGERWESPITVDDQDPQGRVQVAFLSTGDAVVLWMGRSQSGAGQLRVRRVGHDGLAGPVTGFRAVSGTRADGFPRIAPLGADRFLVAWTDSDGSRGQGTENVGVGILEWNGGDDR